MADIHPPRRQ
jgi:hypothetical protein